MKICLIVDDYLPDSIKVAAKMMHELAVGFIDRGHEVCVVTPDPQIEKPHEVIYIDNVKIIRFRSGEIKNVSKISRALNESLLSYKAWNNCKKYFKNSKYDLIVYYSPSIFFGSLVKKLKKLWNAPSYLVLRDIFPQWVVDNNIIREKSFITQYFRHFELKNYHSADLIGLMSQNNLDWFKNKYPRFENVELLYNWATNSPNKENSTYRKELNLIDKTIYFYGGNMGFAQDMKNLIRLAKRMIIHPEAHFLFVGNGDEVPEMKSEIEKHALSNVTLLDSINQMEFKKLLSEIDVGLFTLNHNHKTHNFPGKLLGYMCESKPILGSINPENDIKEVIEGSKAGLVSINGEDEILYKNAIQFLNKTKRENMGLNSNNLLNNYFSIDSAIDKILKLTKL